MPETFCAFCGIRFAAVRDFLYGPDRRSDVDDRWTYWFVALRRKQNHTGDDRQPPESWYLSGVGENMEWDAYALKPGYDIRNAVDEPKGDFVVAYTSRDQDLEVVYPIHADCWDIFLQSHALLAKENASKPNLNTLGQLLASQSLEEGAERGLRPNWTDDYMGAERFWGHIIWFIHEEPAAFEVARSDKWDFLLHDPTDLPNCDELLNNPPLTSNEQPSNISPLAARQGDTLPHLPAEIVIHIFGFLPTASVHALRLASRTFGSVHLNSTYWQTRFDYPNELCHIRLPSKFSSRQRQDACIDWRTLCKKLLRRPESNHFSWQNRKRISLLTRRLVKRLLSIDSSLHINCRARNKARLNQNYRQKISCPNQSGFTEASAVFGGASRIGDLQSISATFMHVDSAFILSGMEFCGTIDTARLGFCALESAPRADLREGESLKKLVAAVTSLGIVGLELTIQSQSSQNFARKVSFGEFSSNSALGQIDHDNEVITGIICEFAENGRIVSIGALETQPALSNAQCAPTISNYLWHPALPPPGLQVTAAKGIGQGNKFSYVHPTIFATDLEASCHLTRVSALLGFESCGIYGFQFHFDDRDPIPAQFDTRGNDVTFLIDGPGGERISSLDIIWSNRTETVGAEFVTNRKRRSRFTTAHVSVEVQIASQYVPYDSCVAGVFGEVSICDEKKSDYHQFGLFGLSGLQPAVVFARNASPADTRQFDDHFNVWTGSSPPPPEYLFGEAVGSQPNHGFINWISFHTSIKRVTVCLGVHARNFVNDPVESTIVGMKFDIQGSELILLGRCTSYGPFFELGEGDYLTGLTIGTIKTIQGSRVLKEILFHTSQNHRIGFKDGGGIIISKISAETKDRFFTSIGNRGLVGMAWSFDIGSGNQRIQPLYHSLSATDCLDWPMGAELIAPAPTPNPRTESEYDFWTTYPGIEFGGKAPRTNFHP